MHVYVILAEEHKPIFSIFNHHQQLYGAWVFQIPVLHKHVNVSGKLKQKLLNDMENKLRDSIEKFLRAFETVFDEDWTYTKEMLGIMEETEEQAKNSKDFGLETIHIISPDGTFLNPKIEDEIEDWGSRGELLDQYRKLKALL
jgi:hypothetical protein